MLMEAKKSYSLDDQIAASHLLAPDPSPPRDAGRSPPGRDAVRGGGRETAMSGERSPSGSHHRKLLMLHTMRALQHDHYETADTATDTTPPPLQPPRDTRTATDNTSAAVRVSRGGCNGGGVVSVAVSAVS